MISIKKFWNYLFKFRRNVFLKITNINYDDYTKLVFHSSGETEGIDDEGEMGEFERGLNGNQEEDYD